MSEQEMGTKRMVMTKEEIIKELFDPNSSKDIVEQAQDWFGNANTSQDVTLAQVVEVPSNEFIYADDHTLFYVAHPRLR